MDMSGSGLFETLSTTSLFSFLFIIKLRFKLTFELIFGIFTPSCSVFPRFLTGPTNLKDPEARFRFPKIFVSAEDGYEELHLIVYKVNHSKHDLLGHNGQTRYFLIF